MKISFREWKWDRYCDYPYRVVAHISWGFLWWKKSRVVTYESISGDQWWEEDGPFVTHPKIKRFLDAVFAAQMVRQRKR